MICFAGIIRHDGEPIPEIWMRSLAGYSGALSHIGYRACNASETFVEFELGPGEAEYKTGVSAPLGLADEELALATISSPKPIHPILLFDGRLDNREKLAAQLQVSAGSDLNDADLVALAYERWRGDCVQRLAGEFAFAIWDPGARRLFLARDAPGMRVLFYSESASLFAFATDLRALLALPFVPRNLREETISDFLCGDGSDTGGVSFYQAVQVLPAGHTLMVDRRSRTQARYWNPSPPRVSAPGSNRDYARDLRERISAAVECRLRGGKNIAVHLSGGLDSSAVACLAARSLKKDGRRLLALCSVLAKGHDGPESDERVFVNAVLTQEDNIDVVWVEPPATTDPFCAFTRWFQVLGQPFYSTVSHIEEMLGEAGRAHGVDVVLSGFGGDFFASCPGYNSVRELLRSGAAWRAASELWALHREQGTPWRQLLKQEILSPLLPARLRARRSASSQQSCAHADLMRRVENRRGRPVQPAYAVTARLSPSAVMRSILAPGHLEQPISSMARIFMREFGQGLRFPLLDRYVIELMLEMPADQLRKDGWPRSLMRRAMKGILPEVIRLRRDKGGAFDPGITSRVVASRDSITAWANATSGQNCWDYVDRARFLEALSAVERAPRARWRPEMFQIVIFGSLIARFLEWHERDWHEQDRHPHPENFACA